MMLAELRARFPFGVLLVTDDASQEVIPAWETDDQQLAQARTAFVMRIRHEVDGPAIVRVWDSAPADEIRVSLEPIHLMVPSRMLRISTAEGEQLTRVPVTSDDVWISIAASDARYPETVDMVVTPAVRAT
jgi:hypothetical protein